MAVGDSRTPSRDRFPSPRGPLSQDVANVLAGARSADRGSGGSPQGAPDHADFQLALWMLHVAQTGGFVGVDERSVSSPRVHDLRWYLQRSFEDQLRALVPEPDALDLIELIDRLRAGGAPTDRSSRETEIERFATKAPYLAWEADPHTLTLARVEPPLKEPLADIQAGEYGVRHGDPHSTVFRRSLAALGISVADALERAPAQAYAFANAAWLFGFERRLRGAALGQLCFLELDSVAPSTAAVDAWQRLGLPAAGRRWYEVHVLADDEHERVVRERLVPAIEQHAPQLLADARWGATVTHHLASLLDQAVRRSTSSSRTRGAHRAPTRATSTRRPQPAQPVGP